MLLIEGRSRPSSMAGASRCTTAPTARYRPSAVPAGAEAAVVARVFRLYTRDRLGTAASASTRAPARAW
jgi:hypothetical protein